MGDEFYAIIKLISGEEIFSLISSDELECGSKIILAQNPIVIKNFETPTGIYTKIQPWMELAPEELFIIKLDHIMTMTECNDKRIIGLYERYLNDTDEGDSLYDETGKVKISKEMGYISSVEDARKKLEDIFNNSIES